MGPQPLNKFMHPRNPYRNPPSFKKLAEEYPEFRKYCSYSLLGKIKLDFKDPLALRALMVSCLHKDFNLKVEIPDGRLVPTLPQRLNYLLWIEDLLSVSHRIPNNASVVGLDIGAGAACIYPLLAAKKFGWKMIASEVDEVNFLSAEQNIQRNNLKSFIFLMKPKELSVILGVLEDERVEKFLQDTSETQKESWEEQVATGVNSVGKGNLQHHAYKIDFIMCNPPFFQSEEETYSVGKSKGVRGPPMSGSTGVINEKVQEGGEEKFISQMIEESTKLQQTVRIFTTLVGAKSHLKSVKQKLSSVSPSHFTVTEFCQGRTMRWGVAWTFDPGVSLERVISKKKSMCQKPLTFIVPRSSITNFCVRTVCSFVTDILREIKIKPKVMKNTKYFIALSIKAYKAMWKEQRKKRRMQLKIANSANITKRKLVEGNHSDPKLAKIESDEAMHENCNVEQCADSENILAVRGDHRSDDVVQSECELAIAAKDNTEEMLENTSTVNGTHVDQVATSSPSKGNLPCLLKCSIHLKQVQRNITMEMNYLGGTFGKDEMNQLMQYIRNKIMLQSNTCSRFE